MHTVSVVIPTYNYAHFLPRAVESVLTQTLPASEVIVVNDGSTDNTPDVLARYGDRIRVIHKRNEGLPAARNTGAMLASGDLIAFLDSDDAWLPRKLELQVRRFGSEPDLGLVHCGVRDVDSKGVPLREHLDGLEGWVALELLLFRRAVILGGGSAAVVRRSAFLEVGGFDTRFRHSEDWDFYYRVASVYKVGFVPEILVHYRLHGGNMHRNVRAMEQAMLLAYAKAFAAGSPGLRRVRRQCYGNLHAVLAGSFFSIGQYRDFLRHAVMGFVLRPATLSRFLGYPVRWLRRRAIGRAYTRVLAVMKNDSIVLH